MANEAIQELGDVAAAWNERFAKNVERIFRREAPKRTGALRKSITVEKNELGGITVLGLFYGRIQNSNAPNAAHTGWIDVAQLEAELAT